MSCWMIKVHKQPTCKQTCRGVAGGESKFNLLVQAHACLWVYVWSPRYIMQSSGTCLCVSMLVCNTEVPFSFCFFGLMFFEMSDLVISGISLTVVDLQADQLTERCCWAENFTSLFNAFTWVSSTPICEIHSGIVMERIYAITFVPENRSKTA